MSDLFNITHETGDLSEYDSTVTDDGDLSVDPAAALAGTYGLLALIDDQTAIYGQKNQTAPTSHQIRLRFHVDPNTLTMADTDQFTICDIASSGPTTLVTTVTLRYTTATGYQIQARAYDDAGLISASTKNITDTPHYVELQAERATSNVSADGIVRYWLDGTREKVWSNVDNYDTFNNMTAVLLGAITAIDAGTSGSLHLDELRANDDGKRIGPAGLAARIHHHYRTRRV